MQEQNQAQMGQYPQPVPVVYAAPQQVPYGYQPQYQGAPPQQPVYHAQQPVYQAQQPAYPPQQPVYHPQAPVEYDPNDQALTKKV